MTTLSDREQFNTAVMMTQLFEARVSQIAAERAAKLRSVVDVASNNQAFWYCSEGGLIQILQDHAYVCTGIHVVSQEINNGSVFQGQISLENLWPSRQATQNAAVPLSLVSATNTTMRQTLTVPIDHFLPAYTAGNTIGIAPLNVDYWYTPVAEWLIERGDTIRCLFGDNTSSVVPVVALSGYKVIG